MTIFYWCMDGLWPDGIHIMFFFAVGRWYGMELHLRICSILLHHNISIWTSNYNGTEGWAGGWWKQKISWFLSWLISVSTHQSTVNQKKYLGDKLEFPHLNQQLLNTLSNRLHHKRISYTSIPIVKCTITGQGLV